MIELRSVRKSFGGTVVVDNVSLTLAAGGVTSIVGPNGAGKSTLLSLISRLQPVDAGRITVDGLDIATAPSDMLARRLSILRQDNAISTRLTVRDLVTFGRFPYSKGRWTAEDRAHVERAVAYLGLEALTERFLDELSGGQRQRAFIAMVLCQDTDYVLLDEPLNNLDMKHSVAMMKLLRRAADELGKTFVVVLHDINFASCYSDRIVGMRGGRIAHSGSPADIMRPQIMKDIFDLDIRIEESGGRPVALYYM